MTGADESEFFGGVTLMCHTVPAPDDDDDNTCGAYVGKPKCLNINLPQYHFVPHKSQTDFPGTEHKYPQWETGKLK
jgi:hypothetical protein